MQRERERVNTPGGRMLCNLSQPPRAAGTKRFTYHSNDLGVYAGLWSYLCDSQEIISMILHTAAEREQEQILTSMCFVFVLVLCLRG